MQNQPWEGPEERVPRPPPEDSATASTSESPASPNSSPHDDVPLRVPARFWQWQVVEEPPLSEIEGDEFAGHEIEGEATVAGSAEPAPYAGPVQERIDDIVVAALAQRRVEVTPGDTATLAVHLVNNGAWPALFEVSVEGWIDERWCPDLPLRVQLQPGDRIPVTLTFAPPREASVQAGEHPLAVVARSPRYPGHMSRIAATLVVRPFFAFTLDAPQPRRLRTSWFQRTATLLLPLTNQSNAPATFHLYALDRRRRCEYRFLVGAASAVPDSAEVTAGAGQTLYVPVEVRPVAHPWVRLFPLVIPFRLTARPEDEPSLRRSVDAEVACAALLGPWQLAALGALMVVVLVGSGLAGLALLLALRSSPAPAAPPPVATAAPPVVTFILKMDEPAPTSGVPPAQLQPEVPIIRPEDVTAPEDQQELVDGVPVVRADQVTAPGEPLPPAAQTPLLPAPGAAPPADGEAAIAPAPNPDQAGRQQMTYAQMFKEVASRYDLSWQMLAAQAYVESGFDSLALSSAGDMGLMQIRPSTWREWAPKLQASDPFDTYSNVLVAAAYLDYLRTLLSQRGYPETEWMLVAYNWGPDQVLEHLAAGGTWESLAPELRQYAQDILQIAATIPKE